MSDAELDAAIDEVDRLYQLMEEADARAASLRREWEALRKRVEREERDRGCLRAAQTTKET